MDKDGPMPAPIETGVQPAKHPEAIPPVPVAEHMVSREKNAEKAAAMTTRTVARFSAASIENRFLKPSATADEEEAKRIGQEAAAQSPKTIPTDVLEKHSLKARAETTQTATGWRKDVAKWIHQTTEDNPQDSENVKNALNSIGIDTSKQGEELDNQIKNFKDTYLKKDQSDIRKFAEDLAKGCQDDNGNIDLTQFDSRLQSINELMNSFGTKDDINLRVKDYATTYALRAQAQKDEGVRNAHAQKVAEHIMHPLVDREQQSFDKIYAEQQKATELTENVKTKLEEAEKNPEETDIVGQAHGKESELQHAFSSGAIDKAEYDEKLAKTKLENKGIARFDTPEELLEALKQLKTKGVFTSEEQMMESYNHEMAHFNVAKRHAENYGLTAPFFNLQVTRNKEGLLKYHPSTQFERPEDDDYAKMVQDEVLLAPGFDHLSEHDWKALGVTKENVEATRNKGRSMVDQVWQDKKLERPDITEDEVILEVARLHSKPKSKEEAEADMADSTDRQADDANEVTDEQQAKIIKEAKTEGIFALSEEKLNKIGLEKIDIENLKYFVESPQGQEQLKQLVDSGASINDIFLSTAVAIRKARLSQQEEAQNS